MHRLPGWPADGSSCLAGWEDSNQGSEQSNDRQHSLVGTWNLEIYLMNFTVRLGTLLCVYFWVWCSFCLL